MGVDQIAVVSNGESAEMNVFNQNVPLKAAGLLILQLAVIVSAQETVPLTASVPDASAPPVATIGAAESSQRQDRFAKAVPSSGTVTKPGKAGGLGDPAFGGQRHPLYRLSKSDAVDVNFTFTPEFNQTITVQPDGFVALKAAGTFFAEGLTLGELQQGVAEIYSRFLNDPEITLTLKDFEKPYFLASGEVTRPGKYELRGDLTVNEAVAMAGGLTHQARHTQVVVFRRISRGVAESHVVDLKKMLDSHDAHEDLQVQAGDFIFVPQSRISKIRKYIPTNAMNWYMNPMQF